MERGHATANIDVEEERTDRLRHDRRKCRPRNPPAEYEDCNWLKRDVDGKRRRQKYGGCFAVPERTDEAILHVEQEKYDKSRKDNRNEVIRAVQNLGRGLHPDEQGSCERQDNRREQERHRYTEQNARRRTPAHTAPIPRTEALPRIDRNARTEPHDKAQCQKHETARTANRCERIHAEEAPDDKRIDKRIELLHHIARDKRQGKEEDEPRWIPLCQILRHSRYLVTKMRSFSCKNTVFVRSAFAFGANLIR